MRRSSTALFMLMLLSASGPALFGGESKDEEFQELQRQVERLENRVQQLEQLLLPVQDELEAKARRTRLRAKFEARTEQDRQMYGPQDLQEIERLYQVANRQWDTPEAQESLKQLVDKYGKANRTGCSVLYLGQMSSAEQKEEYLKRAIAGFGDCWYGDGVQVGPYARFLLAFYCRQAGKSDDAVRLFDEIREQYPDAIDHNGKLLIRMLPE